MAESDNTISRERVEALMRKTLERSMSLAEMASFLGIEYPKRPPRVGNVKRISEPTGRERTRHLVRKRDNFTCQTCGARRTPEEAKRLRVRMFDIHHLNGLCGKRSRAYDKIDDMPGLITLCHKCHFNHPEHTLKTRNLTKSGLEMNRG